MVVRCNAVGNLDRYVELNKLAVESMHSSITRQLGGQPPWGDMKGVDVIKLVEIGKRLTRPPLAPDNVYRIMENCWNYNPKDRPTFQYLTQFFANDPDYQNLFELIKSGSIS